MLFGIPKFESPQEKELEKAEQEQETRKKLINFITQIAENLKIKDNVPLTEDCRIDMEAFNKIYSKEIIKKDQELIEKYESEWYKGLSQEDIKKERLKTDGEKLEMLKTTVFAKGLGQEFIVARTSRYDDIKNNIDNVILEKETGNIICALDEAGGTMNVRYQEKVEKIMARNKKKKVVEN